MRLRPVAAGGFVRVVVRDLRLSNGLVLPRGAMLTGSNLATLNSPAFWDQPQRFLPVRPAGAKLHITSLILFQPDSLQPLRVSVFLSSSVAAARGHADRLQCDHRQQPRCLEPAPALPPGAPLCGVGRSYPPPLPGVARIRPLSNALQLFTEQAACVLLR